MKRFTGAFLLVAGGVALVWGAYHTLTGSSSVRVRLTGDLSVTAFTGGLVGVAAFTAGLLWVRE